jgi:hypothetical protein
VCDSRTAQAEAKAPLRIIIAGAPASGKGTQVRAAWLPQPCVRCVPAARHTCSR